MTGAARTLRAGPETDWAEVAALLRASFAYMEQRLGHPATAALASPEALAREARDGHCWVIREETLLACLFARPSRDHAGAFYIGKLAVAEVARGQGLARRLIAEAEGEARRQGFAALTLDTGAALTELHRAFGKLGFRLITPAGPGSDVVTMWRDL